MIDVAAPYRDEQCPDRAAGLTHIQDAVRRPDGHCVYCGSAVSAFPDLPVAAGSLFDQPHAGVCREGHIAPVCYRIGYADDLEWICFAHLARLVRDHL